MKLFLDMASSYLLGRYELYKRKANIWLAGSLAVWLLTFGAAFAIWKTGAIRYGAAIPLLLFSAILLGWVTGDMYRKSGVYRQIYEDLQEIRQLANKEAEKEAHPGKL